MGAGKRPRAGASRARRSAAARARLLFLSGALWASPFASQAADAEGQAQLRVVLEELEAWDLPSARAAAREMAQRAPDSPATHLALARVAFEEGDYERAVQHYRSAGARGDMADLAEATLKQTRGYQSQESAHFVVRFPRGKDAVLAPYALEALEKQREALARHLGHAPPDKVLVEFFDDARELSRVSTLSLEAIKTTGTIAICKFNRIMATSPKALVRGYDWLDTLAHEYVHLVISQKSRNRVPIWIHEGIAKYFESAWRGKAGQSLSPSSAAMLAQAHAKDALIPFEKMHPSIALLPSQEDAALAYAQVFTAVEYLFDKGGQETLLALLDGLKRGQRPEAAVAAAVGTSFAQFQRDWRAFLSKRPFPKEALPLSAEKKTFKEDDARARLEESRSKDPKKGQEIRFGDFLEIEDPKGRRWAHLGELLRARKRNRAAVEQFAKAHARVGSRSPALSNRYAQALMDLGRLPEAEKVLLASLAPFPGYPRTHQNLAAIYLATDRPALAEQALLEVVGIDPFDPRPHAELHGLYAKRQDALRAERERWALEVLRDPGASANAPSHGAIVVKSHPYARVFLDGVDTGRSTPTQLLVAPGPHVVRLVNEERGFARERTVAVERGAEVQVEVALEDEEPAAPPAPRE